MQETENEQLKALAAEIEEDLLKLYGPVLSGEGLRRALGYPSIDALRQSILRNTVPVPVFTIENRRGKFVLAKDAARWLAAQRINRTKKTERR